MTDGPQDVRGDDPEFVTPPEPPAPVVRRRGRRVTTDPVPGTDPAPAPVDRRRDSYDNDARLRADKPPHWG
ncbi:hypothetical protein AS850_03215 [Frondihabitans sp. 762G35]|uniref:transcriptional regulator n=1 Tax=Frondihabitans sp. 762G35 TaxID=1446794 RepID=UPI000D229A9D|nr:transcriptional regulator [Frondihabitans sp. 762G35]ARC56084.1 hypothetical protein AS850_03215 [Frondihabitans sp. 762G35]